MAIQDSINSAISTVAAASAAHGIMNNQQAQMRATEKLNDELINIQHFKERIKTNFAPINLPKNLENKLSSQYIDASLTLGKKGNGTIKGFTADVVGGKK